MGGRLKRCGSKGSGEGLDCLGCNQTGFNAFESTFGLRAKPALTAKAITGPAISHAISSGPMVFSVWCGGCGLIQFIRSQFEDTVEVQIVWWEVL